MDVINLGCNKTLYLRMIPYGHQNINEADIAAVVAALRSDFLTQGPAVELFEQKVADACGAKHAVCVVNATAALHLACLALELGSGDIAWTSSNTFVASANCARYCDAGVDFVDIDPLTWNMSISSLAEKLESAKYAGRLPKVLIPVHFAGQSCDMDAIGRLAKIYGINVIEDASHAIGAGFAGFKVGACTHSDCAVFSFHPVKIVTTGEGGVIVTNSDDFAERIRRLRSHGITRDAALMRGVNPSAWQYEQIELGYNYRMTDIQAALGSSQLDRLADFVLRRRFLAARYTALLENMPLRLPHEDPRATSSWHLYVVRLNLTSIGLTRREIFDRLRAAGIGVNVHYAPVHLQPYYSALGFSEGHCPEAERYGLEASTLPLYPDLTEYQQDYIVEQLRRLLS